MYDQKLIYLADHHGHEPLYIRIEQIITNLGSTFDLHIVHEESKLLGSIVISVTASAHVLDVVIFALTAFESAELITSELHEVVLTGVKQGLGYKS